MSVVRIKTCIRTVLLCLALVCAAGDQPLEQLYSVDEQPRPLKNSCTSFAIAVGDTVYLCDNEDGGANHPLAVDPSRSTVWLYPAGTVAGGKYGCLWLGWFWGDSMSGQAGMNGKGLAVGLTSVPEARLNPHPERVYSDVADGGLYYNVLRNCATVDEAIELAQNYDITRSMAYQILVADAEGNSVIMGPGSDGELAFTWKKEQKNYLVASTFNATNKKPRQRSDSFIRYRLIEEQLENVGEKPDVSVDLCRSVLDSVSRRRSIYLSSYTMYSSVFDLTNRVVRLYYLSSFEEEVELRLTEELAKGSHHIRLSDLVSRSVRDESVRVYFGVQRKAKVVLAVLGLSALTLLVALAAVGMRFVRGVRVRRASSDQLESTG